MDEFHRRKLEAYWSSLSAEKRKALIKMGVDLANQSGKIKIVASNDLPEPETTRPALPPQR